MLNIIYFPLSYFIKTLQRLFPYTLLTFRVKWTTITGSVYFLASHHAEKVTKLYFRQNARIQVNKHVDIVADYWYDSNM